MASTSFLLPSCLTLLSSGSWTGVCAGVEPAAFELADESGVWGGVGAGSCGGAGVPVGAPGGAGAVGDCVLDGCVLDGVFAGAAP
jgi:hypothetical protein